MREIVRYTVLKVGGLCLTLFLSSIIIFSAMLLTPGDPISAIAGGSRPSAELIAQITADYHLDEPVILQYLRWIGGALSGNFGYSFIYKTEVTDLLIPRLGVTIGLVAFTAILIFILGVGSGIIAAIRGPVVDKTVLVTTSLGMAMPTFVVAIVLIWIFSRELGWLPAYGAGEGFVDEVRHLTLPAISLAVAYIAYTSRITRGALMSHMSAEHVDTARVRGIPASVIFRKHVFLNASPQILSISGITVASLFAASVIAEQAFGINGIGSLLTEAAARKDIPVVQAISLLLVTIFVVLNAIADASTTLIDPQALTSRRRA